MTVLPPEPDGWTPKRGDYSREYLVEVIDLIEQGNCAKGCKRAGGPAEIYAAMAQSGTCRIIAAMLTERPVREIDPRRDGPVCTARIPLDGDQ